MNNNEEPEIRYINDKFHVDLDLGEIIKTSSGEIVPRDEPIFLVRARDYLALPLLEHYHNLCEIDSCNDYQLNGINLQIALFRRFADQNLKRIKQPGCTRGAAWKE